MLMRRNLLSAVLLLVPACVLALGQVASAQQVAGVEIKGDGVLRIRVFDSSGELTKRMAREALTVLDPVLARPSKLRKVSLNRLEAALADRLAKGAGPTDEMQFLAGLTAITHVFYYPETKDIVVAGPAEGFMLDVSGRPVGVATGRSILELQDLIVALRAFPASGEGLDLISVSIDPTKDGLAKMQAFLTAIAGKVTPSDAAAIAAGLKDNLGLQNVSIRGVSPKTHFAQVLVEADYRMKLIGIGLETAPVNIGSYVGRANPRDVSRNAMQRWYFVPNYECVRVSEDELAMELVGEGVKLIGADEMVTAEGARVAGGGGNKASEAFVSTFTKLYPELAKKAPVYAQLRNLINLSIASAFIQKQDYYAQSGWKAELFCREEACPVETYETPKQVETAVNAIWKGNTLMTPIGGGVNIQARNALAKDRLLSDEQGQLSTARKAIKLDKVAKGQWWWD